MGTSHKWTLKRYGRYIPASKGGTPLKLFEANCDKPEMFMTIAASGHLLISQGQESLDAVNLFGGSTVFKVQQKSDNLMLRFTDEGERRMMRMQFDGSSRTEAIKGCSSAVKKLMEYTSVTAQEDAPLPPNQSPAETPAPVIQQAAVGAEPEVAQGSVTIRRLTQHILGEHALILPQLYRNNSMIQGDLGSTLRMLLMDPSFPAFVEKVEGELKKILSE
ncbi:hypothetical protein CesoFtcFv8_000648 [Champsocephalus esox]|uniref:Meiotic recombination protein REC114 n=2 Tax=Champsocephalus TaxID=52236 RepID=A0AAN8E763_CHAGU|nr:hypothetical protein CesoFtcFv8_000648 [Champsocephalus esox]KAK5934975.1 hypothetical protein CgunFtcFv8_020377 [Champsocephalus gunnari]